MTGQTRGLRHETRFRLPGQVRGRGLDVVLGCFAGALGADSAALVAWDPGFGLRSVAAWAREEREPVVSWAPDGLVSRAMESERAVIESADRADGAGVRTIAASVRTHDSVIGAIQARFEPPSTQANEELSWIADSYARLASLSMSDDISFAAALGSASFDPLTGCLSYGAVIEAVRTELQRSGRRGHRVSACVLDIDGFKRVNDERGHLEGNRVLAAIGGALRLASRRYDSVGRFGGDEFMILMPEIDVRGAARVADRFLAAVGDAVAGVTTVRLSASAGITEWDGEASPLELVDAADRAMHVAKAQGGGRVQAKATPEQRLDGLTELTRELARLLGGEDPGSSPPA